MKDKDVSLRDFVQAQIEAEREIRRSEREDDLRAIEKAFKSAEKLAEKHNDLIAQIDRREKDLVTESTYLERHQTLVEAQDRIQERMDKMEGGRRALSIVAAIVVTVLLAAFGLVYGHQLSTTDVSNQVATEAPWLQDKPGITRDISQLQITQAQHTSELDRINALDKFFCDSRQPKLPGCTP